MKLVPSVDDPLKPPVTNTNEIQETLWDTYPLALWILFMCFEETPAPRITCPGTECQRSSPPDERPQPQTLLITDRDIIHVPKTFRKVGTDTGYPHIQILTNAAELFIYVTVSITTNKVTIFAFMKNITARCHIKRHYKCVSINLCSNDDLQGDLKIQL